ncbi:hypothetical protein MHM582_3449 [Microbacterium sp. HM58-2]|nr:hypothetical protein MHM582_3449 [Microbacterium sp. HM58-2]
MRANVLLLLGIVALITFLLTFWLSGGWSVVSIVLGAIATLSLTASAGMNYARARRRDDDRIP